MQSLLLVGAVLAQIATLAAAPAGPTPGDAWRELAAGNAREARALFLLARTRQPAALSETQVGEAVALLNLQPVTARNRDAARQLCVEVAAASPTGPWSVYARYLLGRMAEIHSTPSDLAGAAGHYEWVFTHHPDSEWGQTALVKFAIVQLQAHVAAEETARRYQRLVELEPRLTETSARRDFHLVLAAACFQHGFGREAALRHLLVAEAAGVKQPIRAATVLIQIAELSRELGHLPQARAYYERFLAETGESDTRALLVKERLATLPAGAKP